MNLINPAVRKVSAYLISNLVAGYIVLILFTNLPLYLASLSGSYSAPDFYYVALAMCSILVLFNLRSAFSFCLTPFALWIVFVTCTYALNLWLLLNGDYVVTDIELTNLTNRLQRQSLVFLMAFSIFHIHPSYFFRYLKPVAFFVPILIIVDFYTFGLLDGLGAKGVGGRAEGSYLNANLAAEACAILGVLLHRTFRGLIQLIFFVLIGFAIILTFSRSGIGAWLILGVYLLSTNRLPRYFIVVPILVGVFYTTILLSVEGYLLDTLDGNESSVANMINRLAFFSDVGIDTAQEDSSGAARLDLFVNVLDAIKYNPIVGYVEAPVVAFGDEAHNLILELWYTFGVLGLVMYGWLAWLLLKPHGQSRINFFNPYFLLFLWMSFFDHSQLVVFVWVIFYGLAIRDGKQRDLIHSSDAVPVEKTRKRRRRRKSKGNSKNMSW